MNIRAKLAKRLIQSRKIAALGSLLTGKSKEELHRLQGRILSNRKIIAPLEIALSAIGASRPLTIVQVGANDGKTGDPIHQHVLNYGARALLIEPQPWLIDRLKENYRDFSGELVIENIAIGPDDSELNLHVLKQEWWPAYIERVGRDPSPISSADRAQVLERIAPRLEMSRLEAETAVESVPVPMEPLSNVISRHGFQDADLLQIDCEGWDFKVIQTLGDYRPGIINFESKNLSKSDWQAFIRWSEMEGYGFIRESIDTLAIRGFPNRLVL